MYSPLKRIVPCDYETIFESFLLYEIQVDPSYLEVIMVKVNLVGTPFVIHPSHFNPGNLFQLYFFIKKVLII